MAPKTQRKFEHFAAKRERVPVWLALIGASGSGKTYSALRLATGMCSVIGGKPWLIDTEARRALHYAEQFSFVHVPFGTPFGSTDYLAAVKYCVEQKASVVIVDSMSHEHEGEGGYLDTHEAELVRIAGDDFAKRERAKLAAWVRPSALRSRMLQGLLQLGVSIIFCFRAKERVRPVANSEGRMVPTEQGWSVIGGETLVYEMTASCLLPPRGQGVPQWQTDYVAEKAAMKLPRQFLGILDKGELNEEIGTLLATWAMGNVLPNGGAGVHGNSARPDGLHPDYHRAFDLLSGAAAHGPKVLAAAWRRLSAVEQRHLKKVLDNELKPRAAASIASG